MTPLRIGILGAARIAGPAVCLPAQELGHQLVAVAARDPRRAAEFAKAYDVGRVHETYADVIADADIDVIYNPLPNGLHAPWNIAAVKAGKHVLAEKPFASNAAEAALVRDAAADSGLVVMEAFHYRFHPAIRAVLGIIETGEIGEITHVETVFLIPKPAPDDLRWSYSLAGGSIMDVGCYSLHMQRILAPFTGGEPEIVDGRGEENPDARGLDLWAEARLRYPSGATGRAECGMNYPGVLQRCEITGSAGSISVANFVGPHADDRVTVTTAAGSRVERFGQRTTYSYQLEAFAAAVRAGAHLPLDLDDAVTTMALIDSWYDAIGLGPRPMIG